MTSGLKTKSRETVATYQERYTDAGVNSDEADAGLKKLTRRIVETWPAPDSMGAVKLDIGYFANVIDICGQGIAISTDGIGSKAMIATMLEKYDTVGIDCVAMNVNDIICVGAKPVSMVDYIAIEKVEAGILDAISVGLCVGAKTAGISISGGETAQLKGMVKGFDLAGTAIGHIALDKILIGRNINQGDVVIGVESNGVHSNGLTLARYAFFEKNKYKLSHRFEELGVDLGTELLRPTHIYVQEALELLSQVPGVKALAHITSDGFLKATSSTRCRLSLRSFQLFNVSAMSMKPRCSLSTIWGLDFAPSCRLRTRIELWPFLAARASAPTASALRSQTRLAE